jgi:hypothetical protein
MTNFCKDCLWHRKSADGVTDLCTHEFIDPAGYRVRGEGIGFCLTERTYSDTCGPDGVLWEPRPAQVPEPTVVDTRSVWQVLRDLWRS